MERLASRPRAPRPSPRAAFARARPPWARLLPVLASLPARRAHRAAPGGEGVAPHSSAQLRPWRWGVAASAGHSGCLVLFFFSFSSGGREGFACGFFWAAALCGSGHAGVARAGPARLAHTYPTVRAMMEHNVRWPHPCVLAVPVGLLPLGKRRRAPVRATLFSGGATAAVSAYVGMHFWRTFPDDLLCLPSAPRFHPPPPAPRFLCAARAWSPPLCSCVWALALFPPSLSAC